MPSAFSPFSVNAQRECREVAEYVIVCLLVCDVSMSDFLSFLLNFRFGAFMMFEPDI